MMKHKKLSLKDYTSLKNFLDAGIKVKQLLPLFPMSRATLTRLAMSKNYDDFHAIAQRYVQKYLAKKKTFPRITDDGTVSYPQPTPINTVASPSLYATLQELEDLLIQSANIATQMIQTVKEREEVSREHLEEDAEQAERSDREALEDERI